MKGIIVVVTVVSISLLSFHHHVDAFLATASGAENSRLKHARRTSTTCRLVSKKHNNKDGDGGGNIHGYPSSLSSSSSSSLTQPLTHDEIIWKLRPPPETPTMRKILLRLGANIIRLDAALRGVNPPFCLCPKGGQAVLEAYYQAPYTTFPQKIGRFGITTIRGPPARLIDESVETIYDIDLQGRHVGVAAIVYMFVEEAFRSRDVGALALDVISTIHSIQGCDFTVLVVDDDGSGKLIQWYEGHGYSRAPLLQDLLGSPQGRYGVTMIAPTKNDIDASCRIKWW